MDTTSRGGSRSGQGLGRAVPWIVAGVALVSVVLALLQWTQGTEAHALAAMAPSRRADVFRRTMASFEALCHEDPGASLAADCRREASFLSHFPECDEACRTEVGRYLHSWGTR